MEANASKERAEQLGANIAGPLQRFCGFDKVVLVMSCLCIVGEFVLRRVSNGSKARPVAVRLHP